MTFRFDKLTAKSQEAVAYAQSRAAELGNSELDPLHLLDALLADSEGIVVPLLKKLKVDLDRLRTMVGSEIDRLPKVSGGREPGLSPALRKTLELAAKSAETMGDEYVSTEHLLLGILQSDNKASNVLSLSGINQDDALQALQQMRGSAALPTSIQKESSTRYPSMEST